MEKCECGYDPDKDEAFVEWRRSLQRDYPDWKRPIGVYCPKCRRTLKFHVQDPIEKEVT